MDPLMSPKQVLIKALLFLQIAFTLSDNEFTECTRKCSVIDPDLDSCWAKSLDYFTEATLHSLNSYVSSLLHIERWKTRHPDIAKTYQDFEQASLTRVLTQYSENKELADNGPLNITQFQEIFQMLLNTTQLLSAHYNDDAVKLPSYSCPIPCDYYPKIWMSLFFVMLAIFVLASFSILLFYYVNEQKMVSFQRSKYS